MSLLIVNRRALAILALSTLATLAQAQTYPTKVVTMMVPYPAGGGSDFSARQIQNELSKQLGQQVLVDNLGGASGALGVQKVLSSPADGYEILLGSPMEMVLAPIALNAVKYKPEDMRLVGQLVTTTMVLLTRKDMPANNINELVEYSKTKELSYGSVGAGSLYHLVGERFAQLTNAKTLHVPYKGMAPVLADLMGGQIDMVFVPFVGNVPSLIQEGKVKAMGITAKQHLAAYPKLDPLAARKGFEGFEFDLWAGIAVAKNTPNDVVNKLNKAIAASLQNPEVRKAYEATGNSLPKPMTQAELDKLYVSEIARYQAIAKSINLQPQ
jgi:tripartite-type tricarboxylate transporter receptor subunit TctC